MAMVEMQTTAALAESRRKMQARRRLKNRIALTLSMATMAFGLFWLIWILMSTITRGIDGMSLALFTEMTPPPNTEGGGLANALAGSGLLILWATVFGTPLGIMAGIYLAEYGRKSWLAEVIRFINDILLSAPSIVVGLFCLHHRGGADGALLRLGGRDCAGAVAGADCYPHHREHAETGAGQPA